MPSRCIVLTTSPQPIYNEDRKAGEALIPGQLLTVGSGNFIKHATAGGAVLLVVAAERDEMGKSVDDAYAVNDTVKAAAIPKGGRFLGWLASGQNVADGALLESNGAGQFRAVTTGVVLARAVEAVNATAAAARIRLEAI
jgi:hypothetical protein